MSDLYLRERRWMAVNKHRAYLDFIIRDFHAKRRLLKWCHCMVLLEGKSYPRKLAGSFNPLNSLI